MGCCASVTPPPEYVPKRPSERPPPPAQVEATTSSGFVTVEQKQRKDDPVKPKPPGFLPFVRRDVSKVPVEIFGGDHVYLSFKFSGCVLGLAGDDSSRLVATGTEVTPDHVFRIWRKDGTNKEILDGDEIFLEQGSDSGSYLECSDDTSPLCFAAKDESSKKQLFTWSKQGRPLRTRHGDTVFLESCLHNYVEERYFEDDNIYAKRWERRKTQTLMIQKRAVLESKSTELARKFQFQAFDLDGNGCVTRAELDQVLYLVRGAEVPAEEIDEMMNQADPEGTGNITFENFRAWADGGGMSEVELQHVEVLGNIAQRCNDSIHDNAAFIEVMGTVDVKTAMLMQDEYSGRLQAGSVAEKIIEKAANESDGWFFSGNWKNAMKALLEKEVDLWVRCIDDAMRGWGTDEGSLTALICTIPERLRIDIFDGYNAKTGKHLLDAIRADTSCNYSKVMVWQAMAPEDSRAVILHGAMDGLGTDESQLIRVICQLNFAERAAVKEAYLRLYNKDLVEHVTSETNGYFEGDLQRAMKYMLEATEAEFNLEADCQAMKEAMDGWGADKETLVKLICSKTSKQMEDINAKYYELFGEDLLGRVKSETSGYFKDTLLGCIRHPMIQLVHSVRDCMKGWGTSDSGLIACLVHLEEFKKAALQTMYYREFDRNLIDDIKSDTSGDYERALCALVQPAPQVWANALRGAMKGLGTSDQLLINFMVLAKDEMMEVRQEFSKRNKDQLLEDWIDYECKDDYKDTLMMLAGRNSEDPIDLLPIYWAQRCRDAICNVDTLMDVLVSMPSVAIRRHTQLYGDVYGASLKTDLEKRCAEQCSFFCFTDWLKKALVALLDMPVERICRTAFDAMNGWGTDEYTLTAAICTMPENLYDDIHKMYQDKYQKKLVDHIKSDTSFSYKKVLEYQALPKINSRVIALNRALKPGMFGSVAEDQLIRIIICSTHKERENMRAEYKKRFGKDLIIHIQHECPSPCLKQILMAVLKSVHPSARVDYEGECNKLKSIIDGEEAGIKQIIKILAGKTPGQIEEMKTKYREMFDDQDVVEFLEAEGADWSNTIFRDSLFHAAVLGLLRDPVTRHACAVRDCIVGWGTDDTGLITLLVHLTERQRRDLVSKYFDIPNGGDLYEHIKGDTSGDYKQALLALVKPVPRVWAEALRSSMKGLGTSDNLLINWMCMAKDRMDEVREAFAELNDGQSLVEWLESDCSGDYKKLLVKLANRRCPRFNGQEVGLSMEPPACKEDAVLRFTKAFNKLCKQRKSKSRKSRMFDQIVTPDEEDEQEMGCAFLYYGSKSSCAPNLDIPGLWDLTNVVGFPPADSGPDLVATFHEWDYSGSGEITWNDFVREMKTRINDPNHFNAPPLAETIDELGELSWEPCQPVQVYGNGPEEESDEEPPVEVDNVEIDFSQAYQNKAWKQLLRDLEPEVDGDGALSGPWGDVMQGAVTVEHTVPDFQAEFGEGPAGQVIDFLNECGHESFVPAAEQKEQLVHGNL